MARRVADAVLYEGYMLYPYRASALKNQVRWQFGVLTPPGWSEGTDEPWFQRTECLVEERDQATLAVRLRFLQVQGKRVEEATGEDGFRPVDSLEIDGVEHFAWDEGVARDIDEVVPLAMLVGPPRTIPVQIPGGTDEELLRSADGSVRGRLVRERRPVDLLIRLSAEVLPGPYGTVKLTLLTENTSSWADVEAGRTEALRRSMVAAHTLLALTGGEFISLLDPPEWATGYVQACSNEHTWPALVGEEGDRGVMLSSPIILYDYPQIAPESAGDLFDATEIDEILLLRTMTLTDEEKREARATDPRTAAIIDRADHLPPELLERLHGAVRYLEESGGEVQPPRGPERPDAVPWWDPGSDPTVSPETDAIQIAGVEVSKGSRVVLRPRPQRADAQDIFLLGRVAQVEAVLFDVDGKEHLAVTLEDDPGADLQQANGRFLYFSPDEVDPLGTQGGSARERSERGAPG
jgi:hypothetical protein